VSRQKKANINICHQPAEEEEATKEVKNPRKSA
jgi:hypothetical protein